MEVFLPIAGKSINIFLVVGIGGIVGFLSGLFGVGGGFLLTPLMMWIGIPPAVAAASDSNQIVAAASSGAAAHYRMGHVDIKIGLILVLGGVTGSTIGVQVVRILREFGNFEFAIKATYVVMLGGVGGLMFVESLGTLRRSKGAAVQPESGTAISRKIAAWFVHLPVQMNFPRLGLRTSALFPFTLGTFVGFLAALMGVGGGFIMVPAMIYLIGMPTVMAIGTDLFQIVLTTTSVTLQQAIVNHTVDVMLAVLLFCGSVFGAQIGARVSKRLRGEQIRIFLAIIVLAMTVKLLFELVLTPDNVITYVKAAGGH